MNTCKFTVSCCIRPGTPRTDWHVKSLSSAWCYSKVTKSLGNEVLWGILDVLFKWITDVYLYHSLLFQAMRWAGLFHVPL